MSNITLSLTEEKLQRLRDLAARLAIPPEELARIGVEELLALPEADFARAMDHVLKKNAELYHRSPDALPAAARSSRSALLPNPAALWASGTSVLWNQLWHNRG